MLPETARPFKILATTLIAYLIALSYEITRGVLTLIRALKAGFHFEERL